MSGIESSKREDPAPGQKGVTMSRARQGPKEELTVQQDQFVRMEANGYSSPDIIKAIWGISKGEEGYHSAECKLSRWRKHPKYTETWMDEVRKNDFGDYVKARATLRRSMDDSDKWLAMQSAVNVMSTAGKRIYGQEDNTVHVQIEGMPDIGSPEED